MARLAVSQSFIDDLCKNLQFALDLTSNFTKQSRDKADKIQLDSRIWTAIVDSHIATLNTHKAIIEGLAANLQGSTSKASAQALQKLQRGASLAVAGAREAKLALVCQVPLSGWNWFNKHANSRSGSRENPRRGRDYRLAAWGCQIHQTITISNKRTTQA